MKEQITYPMSMDKALIMRKVRSIYVTRAAIEAFKRFAMVSVVLSALAPIFEILGIFSVERIVSNIPRELDLYSSYGFFSTAIVKSELSVQIVTAGAFVMILGTFYVFIRNIVSIRRIVS
jgi:hypothetical protein